MQRASFCGGNHRQQIRVGFVSPATTRIVCRFITPIAGTCRAAMSTPRVRTGVRRDVFVLGGNSTLRTLVVARHRG
jgi:hypothetical protein